MKEKEIGNITTQLFPDGANTFVISLSIMNLLSNKAYGNTIGNVFNKLLDK